MTKQIMTEMYEASVMDASTHSASVHYLGAKTEKKKKALAFTSAWWSIGESNP